MDWLADTVSWEAELPLRWQAGTATRSEREALAYLQIAAGGTASDVQGDTLLHAKLDLLLLWLARAQGGEPATLTTVCLGLEGARWRSRCAWPLEAGVLAVQLLPDWPALLPLPAKIVACEADQDGWQCWARWEFGSEVLEDAWGQAVFRQHRRQIQLQRAGKEAGDAA